MKPLEYFGTDLHSHGHYMWDITHGFFRGRKWADAPDVEMYIHKNNPKGHVEFEQIGKFSLLFIIGSCVDKRGGTVSVFFVEETITKEQLIERIKENETAMRIINQMDFEVNLSNEP